jgi:RNA polymerase sigma-70 factor (ECF subfamily)
MLARLETYGPRLYSVALRITGNHADAEDVVQETYLRAHRKLEQFRGDADLGTWLYRIAIRVASRLLRKRGNRGAKLKSFSELLPFGDPTLPQVPAAGSGPEAEEERAEERARVLAGIALLPPNYRIPLVLKDIAELESSQGAAVLGMKDATFKTRVHRARLMLRSTLLEGRARVALPPPAYDRQMCMDLLQAKMASLDRGVAFPVQDELVCERCKNVFDSLDYTHRLCVRVSKGEFPTELRTWIRANTRAIKSRKSPTGKSVSIALRPRVGSTASARARARARTSR